jgi:protein-S-isoprenylcysteine O-methyltransferase Ste14
VLLFVILAVAAAHFPAIAAFLTAPVFFAAPLAGWIGAACAVLGIGFAVWARAHLGRDWSSHPDVKEGHELVTSGPYAYVRHPIYTGVILAAIGSAIGTNYFWMLIVLAVVVMFLLRIPKEEGYMMELFPEQYPAYRARTKRLIPFIW